MQIVKFSQLFLFRTNSVVIAVGTLLFFHHMEKSAKGQEFQKGLEQFTQSVSSGRNIADSPSISPISGKEIAGSDNIGSSARKFILRYYSGPVVARSLIDLYDDILNRT